jgi:hypothetical protein
MKIMIASRIIISNVYGRRARISDRTSLPLGFDVVVTLSAGSPGGIAVLCPMRCGSLAITLSSAPDVGLAISYT